MEFRRLTNTVRKFRSFMMRYVITVSVLFLLSICSCDKLCQGCGPTSSSCLKVRNSSNEYIQLISFTPSADGIRKDTFSINSMSVESIHCISNTLLSDGLDITSITDSLQVFRNGFYDRTYLENECNNKENPLCELNYELVQENVTDEHTHKDYVFVID